MTARTLVDRFAAHLGRRYGRPIPVARAEGLERLLDGAPAALAVDAGTPDELRRLAEEAALNVEFAGCAGDAAVAVLTAEPLSRQAPAGFTVRAFMTAFNEADIVRASVEHLLDNGVEVSLVDNWSTDGTWEIAQELARERGIAIERFPPEGPSAYFELRRLLGRIEELSSQTAADWCVHVDADELRIAPWPSTRLRDALFAVGRAGFTAVDHTVLVFPPTDEAYEQGMDPEQHFRHVEFGRKPGHRLQVKAWRRSAERVGLAGSGGHDATFEGRRTFPFNFLTKHYPIRSQSHGVRKVLEERQRRYAPAERADGWHVQYDAIGPGHRFLRDPSALEVFEPAAFLSRHLVACLGRIGIRGLDETARVV